MKARPKTSLTMREVIQVAYSHLVMGTDQQKITATLGLSNSARVAEAVVVMRYAAENHDRLYDEWKKKRPEELAP